MFQMSIDRQSTKEYVPLFSRFLNKRSFLVLYVAGCISLIASIHMSGSLPDSIRLGKLVSSEIGLGIFLFLAPTVYYLVKKIREEFESLFEKDLPERASWSMRAGSSQAKEIAYLFSDNEQFALYRHGIQSMLHDSREKYIALGLSFCLILPLSLLDDSRNEILSSVFSGSLYPWSALEYICYTAYWAVIFSLLISVVWMIVTAARALLNLKIEKPYLHITKSIEKAAESLERAKETDLSRAKIGLLDLAFRRFRAGLSPIVNFVLYLSLEIAFVSVLCSIPALAFFLLSDARSALVWYGLCISACALSVSVFVIGQYGVWRLWASSKKDILKLLDHVCAEKIDTGSSFYSSRTSHSRKEAKEIEEYVSFVQRFSIDMNQLTTMTYTSSAIFKLISLNFLAFAPLMLEIFVIRLWLK